MVKISQFLLEKAIKFLFLTLFISGSLNNVYGSNQMHYQTNFDKELPKPIFQNKQGTFFMDLSGTHITSNDFHNQIVEWFGLNSNHTFEIVRAFVDEIGYKHETFQHLYKGIKVENDLVFVHSKADKVQSVNGQTIVFNDLNINFDLSDEDILTIAANDFSVKSNVKSADFEIVISKIPNKDKIDLVTTKKVKLFSFVPMKSMNYFIDNSGKIINKFKNFKTADAPGSGTTYYRGTQNFTVDSILGQYRLKDNQRNISTFNAQNIEWNYNSSINQWTLVGNQHYLNSSTNFTSIASKPAVEVHWAMSKTFDYYKNIHNRDSYDNSGAAINNYYDYPESFALQNNAYAADYGFFVGMYFGNGGGVLNPVVGIDVAGHEFSHLVIGRNGNGGLIYQGESGALNESFADMFGTAIEFYANVNPNWTIGEGIVMSPTSHPFFRDMTNPNNALSRREQPDTYQGNYWKDPYDVEFDYGGVHYNSGVGNYWFYLLSEVFHHTGTNDLGNSYYVYGIGINKAEKIVYKALMEGLTPSATYLDAFNATKQAATALYGLNSNEYNQVVNAWYAVGIGDSPVSTNKNELKVKFSIYPNPTNDGVVTIESQLDENTTVQVYDLLGKQVTSIFNIEKGTNVLNINNLSNGVYLLVFKAKGLSFSEKLIKR